MIPMNFIRTHDHKLDMVMSLTAPMGITNIVPIKTYPPVSVRGKIEIWYFLGPGWKEFGKESGFQVGDCVLFKLVGNLCFHVYVSSKLKEKVVVKATPRVSKCGKGCGLGKFGREDDGNIS